MKTTNKLWYHSTQSLVDSITSQTYNIIALLDNNNYLKKASRLNLFKIGQRLIKTIKKIYPKGIEIVHGHIPVLVILSGDFLNHNQQLKLAKIDYKQEKIDGCLKINTPSAKQKIYLVLDVNPFAYRNVSADKAVDRTRKEGKYNFGFAEACALVREKKHLFIEKINSQTNKMNIAGERFYYHKTPTIEFLPNQRVQLFDTVPWWKNEHFFNPTFTMVVD